MKLGVQQIDLFVFTIYYYNYRSRWSLLAVLVFGGWKRIHMKVFWMGVCTRSCYIECWCVDEEEREYLYTCWESSLCIHLDSTPFKLSWQNIKISSKEATGKGIDMETLVKYTYTMSLFTTWWLICVLHLTHIHIKAASNDTIINK